ncbi:MAG: hypothetical protein ABL879_03450 [Devosia sp.]
MDSSPHDIAVFGSTPLALLLAGALAARHEKRVILVGERYSPLRLSESLHLCALPSARPETWSLLATLEAETAVLLAEAGAPAPSRTTVTLHAEQSSVAALAHIRHLAAAYGLRTEADKSGSSLRLRGVATLAEDTSYPALDSWMDRLGIIRLPGADTELSVLKNGSAVLTTGAQLLTAKHAVLADDTAIMSVLHPAARPYMLRIVDGSATLTSKAKPLADPVSIYLDRGVDLSMRGERLIAHVRGHADADARLGSCLAGQPALVRAATRKLRRLEASDGAPVVGLLQSPRLFVAAGLGDAAAFFAPALARIIAGAPAPGERAWFTRHAPSQSADRTAIADYAPAVFA